MGNGDRSLGMVEEDEKPEDVKVDEVFKTAICEFDDPS